MSGDEARWAELAAAATEGPWGIDSHDRGDAMSRDLMANLRATFGKCKACRDFYRGVPTPLHDLELGCAPDCPCQHNHAEPAPTDGGTGMSDDTAPRPPSSPPERPRPAVGCPWIPGTVTRQHRAASMTVLRGWYRALRTIIQGPPRTENR